MLYGLLNAELKGSRIMGRLRSCFHPPTLALQARVEYVNLSSEATTAYCNFFHNFLQIIFAVNNDGFYYASIRSLSLRSTFLGCFFDIGSAISQCGAMIEQHYSRRK